MSIITTGQRRRCRRTFAAFACVAAVLSAAGCSATGSSAKGSGTATASATGPGSAPARISASGAGQGSALARVSAALKPPYITYADVVSIRRLQNADAKRYAVLDTYGHATLGQFAIPNNVLGINSTHTE